MSGHFLHNEHNVQFREEIYSSSLCSRKANETANLAANSRSGDRLVKGNGKIRAMTR